MEIISKSYLSLLPKFENMEGMVTVARSRGIRFLFVLQSFSQLTAKYGKDIGDIVKTNCNVKIFIGSDDPETRKEFSELCGNKKVKNFSVNTNAENPASSNTGANNQPLITIGMLERLNGNEKGDAIVSVRGYEPIWTRFTPSFKLKEVYFKDGKADIGKREAVLFEKQNYVFDITGQSGKAEENRVLDAIEERDSQEEVQDNKEDDRIAKLDMEWLETVEEIDKRANLIKLTARDKRVLKSTKLDDKADLLYMMMDGYKGKLTIQSAIRSLAEYISGEALPKLMELQNSAAR